MIVIRRRQSHQQVGYYHLSLSILLLFLTVYPYLFNNNNICCSVAAYSAQDFDLKHSSISNFDIIETSDIIWSKSISTREAVSEELLFNDDEHTQYNDINAITNNNYNNYINKVRQTIKPIREVHFSSLGRRFNLILNEPTQITTHDFSVISIDADGKQTTVPYKKDDFQILNGFVNGDKDSKVTASLNKHDKLMTAQIRTGSQIVIVEPTYLHKDNIWTANQNLPDNNNSSDHQGTSTLLLNSDKLFNDTMIVYKLQDHKEFDFNNQKKLFNPEKLCNSVRLNSEYHNFTTTQTPIPIKELEQVTTHGPKLFYEDNINIFSRNLKYNVDKRELKKTKRNIDYSAHGDRVIKDKTRCTLHLVADYLFYKHVGNGDQHTTINYLLALIDRVNQIYLPSVWETGNDYDNSESFTNIGFIVQNITIHPEYSRIPSGDKHYNMNTSDEWSAREFLDNFSKYSPPSHYCLAHLLTYRRFDSPVLGLAYVASTRYGAIGGICSPIQQKDGSYYKHNTGISTSKGINGETLITRQADLVVAHELGHNLGAEHDPNECRPSPSEGGAYLMHPFAVMGFEKNNKILSNCSRLSIGRIIKRKASTCFVSVRNHVCGNGIVEDNEECDGGDVGFGFTDPCCDSSCRFTPGSQCSDRHSFCCSKCHISPPGQQCRPPEVNNCKQASYCNGTSAECPKDAEPVEDNTVCVGRGLCQKGDCIPFCEARQLISCLCNTPKDACKLCCKASVNGTCVPYDNRAPYLDDGLLCYRGVCEKGRCEQQVQDAIERLWDVLEDINFTTFVKFLRDNIIFVVLLVSIPIWCIFSYLIAEFDKRVREDVMNAIARHNKRRKNLSQSPFLPRLFVGDEISNSNSNDGDLNNGGPQQLHQFHQNNSKDRPLRPIGIIVDHNTNVEDVTEN